MPTVRARPARAAADPISNFFAVLSQPGHLATFEGESATIRFDVLDGKDSPDGAGVERWYLTVTNGDVAVSRRNSSADAIVRIQRPNFEAMVTGRLNAQAAILRGLLTFEGNISALMMFQRALPGPPGSAGRVAPISSQTVMAQRRPA